MQSRKDRLPKGRSYPLKPPVLEAAIVDAGLTLPIELTRSNRLAYRLNASFFPDDAWPKGNYIWVSCGAVPSERAAEIRAILETRAIPAFIKWAKEIEALDAKSPRRRKAQHFDYPFPAGNDR